VDQRACICEDIYGPQDPRCEFCHTKKVIDEPEGRVYVSKYDTYLPIVDPHTFNHEERQPWKRLVQMVNELLMKEEHENDG
jgi:hypothetical protein